MWLRSTGDLFRSRTESIPRGFPPAGGFASGRQETDPFSVDPVRSVSMKILQRIRHQFSPWIIFMICVTIPVVVFGDADCVRFDVPSAIPSCDVTAPDRGQHDPRLVEIVIPVSVLAGCRSDQRVLEMMIQIRGLGNGIQVADYGPRTRLYSDIDGPIAVEQRQDRNSSVALGAAGTAADVLQLDAKASTGKTSGHTERYQRIPEQKLLLASGTINRGSGAYFKFRHSPQTTLEGGHEIILVLQVPPSWRGGLLRVDCLASGKEKYLLGEGDFSAGQASFVVATWLKGDVEARQTVQQYSMLESQIRNFARSMQRRSSQRPANDLLGGLLGKAEASLPGDWATRFALFDSRSIEGRIKPHLPRDMQQATERFLASRRDVLRLGR
jgi:hypothetical protein